MTIKSRLEMLEKAHQPPTGPLDPLSQSLLELYREKPDFRAMAEDLESDTIGGINCDN